MLKLELPDNELEPDLEIRIAWPPSINSYYRSGIILPSGQDMEAAYIQHGQEWRKFWHWLRRRVRTNTFLSEPARTYREAVAWQLARVRERFGDADIVMELTQHPPTRLRPDIDNFLKATFDAVEHAGIFTNDRQIVQLLLTRGQPVKLGETHIRIWRSRA